LVRNDPIVPTRTVEQLTAIIDSVPTAVIMVDQRGTIVLVNAQAERLFGYKSVELLGEMIDILVPYRFRAEHPELRARFTKSPQTRPMGAGRDLPIVILTTSDAPEDVLISYKLRCNSYIVKPVDFEQFSKVVHGIADYWFTLVVLPPEPR
jgi:hypothetical protein